MIENRKLNLLYRPFTCWRRTRVIDDPVLRPVWRNPRRAEKNHYVIRKLLDPGLIEEEQIAGRDLRLQAADGAHGNDALRSQQLHRVNVRTVIDFTRQDAVPAPMPRQERHALIFQRS